MSVDQRENGVQSVPVFESLEDFVNSSDPTEQVRWQTFLVPLELVILEDNIRPFDYDFIETLAASIKEQGQLQECIGDVILDGEDGKLKVRLIAGQHREKAIRKINTEMTGELVTQMMIRVRVANRTLNPQEVLSIQISENLQNKMTSAQEANVIHALWEKLKKVGELEDRNVSMAELARRAGRNIETIRDAIKYVEGINPLVQTLVDGKILPYSQALLLASFESGNGYNSEQLRLAEYFVAKKFNLEKAKKYILQLKEEKNFAGPLFGNTAWEVMEIQSHVIAIRTEADRNGKDATGWFVKMVRMVELLGKESQVDFSKAIQSAILELDISLEEFKGDLKPLISQKAYVDLFGESN